MSTGADERLKEFMGLGKRKNDGAEGMVGIRGRGNM
jgi:hypothetical protein